MRGKFILSIATLICSSPGLAQQTSLADQKTETDIAKERADILKEQLDEITSVKGIADGKTTLTGVNASAETMMLADLAIRGAAEKLANEVVIPPCPPAGSSATRCPDASSNKASCPIGESDKTTCHILVVIGSQRPPLTDYLSFQRTADQIKRNLDTSVRIWNASEVKPKPKASKPKADKQINKVYSAAAPGLLGSLSGVAGVGGAITSVASLFNVDREISGSAYASNDAQMMLVLQEALAHTGLYSDMQAFRLDDAPAIATKTFEDMRPSYDAAENVYENRYLRALRDAGGKPDSLPPSMASAGKNLETATADYRALEAKLFTPVNGILPAAEIDREAKLAATAAAGNEPILYVRNYQASITTVTRHGFLIGVRTTPATVKAAAVLDYVIVKSGSDAKEGTVYCSTGAIAFDNIDAQMRSRFPADATKCN